ncbi:GNAT family N-acetyltransferase [Candidatus Woesearchaeota archaeon]|nr:GNAT family N-acetyltransferase [Candidatus Woesearchaeota archaeon]
MVRIIQYSSKYREQTINLIKEVLESEFGFKVNKSKRPDLYDINEAYQKKGGNFWIALEKDEVIGTVGLLNYGKNRGFLKRMYVDKRYRGKGAAKKLLLELINFAKNNNYKTIFVPTVEEMIAANKFYQKNGFKRIESLPEDFNLEEDTVFYRMDI